MFQSTDPTIRQRLEELAKGGPIPREDAARAMLDPEIIRQTARDNAERTILEAGHDQSRLIPLARYCVDYHLGMIVQIAELTDPKVIEAIRFGICEAMASRLAELTPIPNLSPGTLQ